MSVNLSIPEDDNGGDDATNFASIFDGKSLEGWDMAGKGKFVIVRKDKALQSEGGTGLLWYTKKKYNDFILNSNGKYLRKVIILEFLYDSLILTITQVLQLKKVMKFR